MTAQVYRRRAAKYCNSKNFILNKASDFMFIIKKPKQYDVRQFMQDIHIYYDIFYMLQMFKV